MSKDSTPIKIALPIFLSGIGLGILLFIAVRFLWLPAPEHTHYHANFAIVINGQQDELEAESNYEGVAACSLNPEADPGHRVHLHKPDNDVVHVHAPAVTWGHFFDTINYVVDGKLIKNSQGMYHTSEAKTIRFTLNGETLNDISNRVIGDEDRLLVYYGDTDEAAISSAYSGIDNKAAEFNEKDDPATCAGEVPLTWQQKLRRAIWVE